VKAPSKAAKPAAKKATKKASKTAPLPPAFAEAARELRTVRDWVRFADSQFHAHNVFFGHGSVSAFDEAVYLVLHTLNLPLDELEPFLDAMLTSRERETLAHLLARRVHERVPAAYLTHEAWLGEHKFYVDERVIVPRSFIAELLREDLSPWVIDPESVTRVADICTGSGCLAILAAITFPNAIVDAVDLSPDALEVAKRNVANYGLEDRVNLIASDMFSAIGKQKYDVIISNPPYVTGESMSRLPDEYLREPQMALASGDDGLDHTRTLIANAKKHLNPEGVLVVEVGFNRDGVEAAFPRLPFVWAEVSAGDEVVFVLEREALPGKG
jgi:ribosomal protein L3 glutamine methyltransferase